MKEKVVIRIYYNENEGVSAIRRLQEMGYDKKDISILVKVLEPFESTYISTETPTSDAAGAGAGAVTGSISALLAELEMIVIPSMGPFLAAGPIATTLGRLIAGGAVGGIVGTLVGLGVDKSAAEYFETELETGDLLIMAKACDDFYDRVTDIFRYPEEEYYKRYERNTNNPKDLERDGKEIETYPLDLDRYTATPVPSVRALL